MASKDTKLQVLKEKNITNPIRNVKQDLRKYLSKEEIDERLQEISNHKKKMFIRFLWMSGVRVTEAINLEKKDLDLQNYLMTVKWLKSRRWNERVVPIHPLLKNILELYVAPLKSTDKIFPYSRQHAWTICKKEMNCSPHQLRHSFAVHWLKNGSDIVTLHKILGHSKIQTTMEYLNIVPIDQGKELIKIPF